MKQKLLTIWCVICFWIYASAQSKQKESVFLKDEVISKFNSLQIQSALRQYLPFTEHDELVNISTDYDSYGYTHEKYFRRYKGKTVEDEIIIVHIKDKKVSSVNGKFSPIQALDTEPRINESAAFTTGLNKLKSKPTIHVKLNLDSSGVPLFPKGELIVREQEGKFRLVYKFSVASMKPMENYRVYVDAIDGTVSVTSRTSELSPWIGNADTRYSGTHPITSELVNGKFYLKDLTRGIITKTLTDCPIVCHENDIIDDDGYWSADEYNNINEQNGALDAHWGAAQAYDYFKLKHGRSSYDNSNGVVTIFMIESASKLYASTGADYRSIYIGNNPHSMSTVDVVAHEYGHLINNATAGLADSFEPGALNEGLSDIWGACTDYYTAIKWGTAQETWEIGEDVETFRSINNPTSIIDPWTGTPYPETYFGPNWYYGVDGHHNSTVASHWFYLLAHGGSCVNDNGNSYSVLPIGIENAEKIIYLTETSFLHPQSGFVDLRILSTEAAKIVFPNHPEVLKSISDAWDAVEVFIPTNSGAIEYCTLQNNNENDWIEEIKVGTMHQNLNFKDVDGYFDFTPTYTFNAVIGETYTIELKAQSGNSAKRFWRIWIDFNLNGIFEQTEIVYTSQNASIGNDPLIDHLVIPVGVSEATTTMRIVMRPDEIPLEPCNSTLGQHYGDAQDYNITLSRYCSIAKKTPHSVFIDHVKLGLILNDSDDDQGYGDYTNFFTNVTPGAIYNLEFSGKMKVGNGDIQQNGGDGGDLLGEFIAWGIWIDFNRNGLFEDSESIFSKDTLGLANVYSKDFTVPSDAMFGKTRMRISVSRNLQGPCTNASETSEIEDYTIFIKEGFNSSKDESAMNAEKLNERPEIYPNPFTEGTTIRYNVPELMHVSVSVYNMQGQHIKTLVDERHEAGPRSVGWNGTNQLGNAVPKNAFYVYKLNAGGKITIGRMELK